MRRIIALAILAAAVHVPMCLAQDNTAVTIGVKDESGAVVEGAEVSIVATNQKQAVPKVLRTGSKGITTLGLPPGAYDLSVKMTGFRPVTKRVVVSDAIHQTFAITLKLGKCPPGPCIDVVDARPRAVTAVETQLPSFATLTQPSTVAGTAVTAPQVRVPDEATALSIAEPALVKVYGKKQIDYEKPLKAVLESGVWHVYGTLCCPDSKGRRTCESGKCVGGVAQAEIRQDDGKVLKISHTM